MSVQSERKNVTLFLYWLVKLLLLPLEEDTEKIEEKKYARPLIGFTPPPCLNGSKFIKTVLLIFLC